MQGREGEQSSELRCGGDLQYVFQRPSLHAGSWETYGCDSVLGTQVSGKEVITGQGTSSVSNKDHNAIGRRVAG